jgi:hypothetical protein
MDESEMKAKREMASLKNKGGEEKATREQASLFQLSTVNCGPRHMMRN